MCVTVTTWKIMTLLGVEWWLQSQRSKHHPRHCDLFFFLKLSSKPSRSLGSVAANGASDVTQVSVTSCGWMLRPPAQVGWMLPAPSKGSLPFCQQQLSHLAALSSHGEGPSCWQTFQGWREPTYLFLLCSGLPSSFHKNQRYVPSHHPKEPGSVRLLGMLQAGVCESTSLNCVIIILVVPKSH